MRLITMYSVLLLLTYGYVSPATAQKVHFARLPGYNTKTYNEPVRVDNCEGSAPIIYDLSRDFSMRDGLTIENGWSLGPSLNAQVPGIGTVGLSSELSSIQKRSKDIEQTASSRLRVQIGAGTNQIYRVSIEDTFQRGSLNVESGFGPFKKTASSAVDFLVNRKVTMAVDDEGCYFGRWELQNWHEVSNRKGLQTAIGWPQSNNIRSGVLAVDKRGIFSWSFELHRRGGGPVSDLRCVARLDENTKRLADVDVTWGPRHGWQLPAQTAQEETSFALCGQGIDLARGPLGLSVFSARLVTGMPRRILDMTNGEGTLRWSFIGY